MALDYLTVRGVVGARGQKVSGAFSRGSLHFEVLPIASGSTRIRLQLIPAECHSLAQRRHKPKCLMMVRICTMNFPREGLHSGKLWHLHYAVSVGG